MKMCMLMAPESEEAELFWHVEARMVEARMNDQSDAAGFLNGPRKRPSKTELPTLSRSAADGRMASVGFAMSQAFFRYVAAKHASHLLPEAVLSAVPLNSPRRSIPSAFAPYSRPSS